MRVRRSVDSPNVTTISNDQFLADMHIPVRKRVDSIAPLCRCLGELFARGDEHTRQGVSMVSRGACLYILPRMVGQLGSRPNKGESRESGEISVRQSVARPPKAETLRCLTTALERFVKVTDAPRQGTEIFRYTSCIVAKGTRCSGTGNTCGPTRRSGGAAVVLGLRKEIRNFQNAAKPIAFRFSRCSLPTRRKLGSLDFMRLPSSSHHSVPHFPDIQPHHTDKEEGTSNSKLTTNHTRCQKQ